MEALSLTVIPLLIGIVGVAAITFGVDSREPFGDDRFRSTFDRP